MEDADTRLGAHFKQLARLNQAMAHDIRGPLNTLALNLELLKMSLQRDPDSEWREQRLGWLRVLNEELRRAHGMIETLLLQTRVSEGVISTLDLRSVVRELESLIRAHCRRMGVTLVVSLPTTEVFVAANGDELGQVLLSLVMAVLDSEPEGGPLRLSLSTDVRCATIVMAIPDEPGQPGDPRMKQAESAASPADRAIGEARAMLEPHGGRILSPESPGMGRRIEITLPLT